MSAAIWSAHSRLGDEDPPRYYGRDTAAGKVGQIMSVMGDRVWLRPVGGGVEWEAGRSRVVRITEQEAKSEEELEVG